ncbi:hypothetical protein N9J72_01545 [Candidatus Gracilibacteria bacterium]|nr:hypothetical protein [Candidatus Gracilibacteria bacterium]
MGATETQTLDIRLQENLEKVEQRLQNRSLYRKIFIYTNLKNYTQKYLGENTVSENKRYILSQAVIRIESKIRDIEKLIKLSQNFTNHNTLSLSFNNSNIDQVILQNSEALQNSQSIFVFRDSVNLSRTSIQKVVDEIQKIQANILIFIDQEGGQINRYQDFDTLYTREDILNDSFMQVRKNKLSEQEYTLFLSLFPNGGVYFPSLYQVGSLYDSFSKESANIMLEMFAYMRLKSHVDLGINTYGLMTDLSRGNPSITPLGRSFSKHSNKYMLFLDAFAIASRETGVLVYLKHFPGVGLGVVDSHNGVLDLRNNESELQENMKLFEYARQTFGDFPLGVMLGHVIVPNTLESDFTEIAQSFDFMITDDLGMQGYLGATGKTFQDGFFSIDELQNSENLLILDRKSTFYIK